MTLVRYVAGGVLALGGFFALTWSAPEPSPVAWPSPGPQAAHPVPQPSQSPRESGANQLASGPENLRLTVDDAVVAPGSANTFESAIKAVQRRQAAAHISPFAAE